MTLKERKDRYRLLTACGSVFVALAAATFVLTAIGYDLERVAAVAFGVGVVCILRAEATREKHRPTEYHW